MLFFKHFLASERFYLFNISENIRKTSKNVRKSSASLGDLRQSWEISSNLQKVIAGDVPKRSGVIFIYLRNGLDDLWKCLENVQFSSEGLG